MSGIQTRGRGFNYSFVIPLNRPINYKVSYSDGKYCLHLKGRLGIESEELFSAYIDVAKVLREKYHSGEAIVNCLPDSSSDRAGLDALIASLETREQPKANAARF